MLLFEIITTFKNVVTWDSKRDEIFNGALAQQGFKSS